MSPLLRQTWAESRERLRHLRLRGCVEAYVDGELTGTHRARVAAHLARCWSMQPGRTTSKIRCQPRTLLPRPGPESVVSLVKGLTDRCRASMTDREGPIAITSLHPGP
jgi:hypothetical protein